MEHWQCPQIDAVEPKTNAQAVPESRKVSPSVAIYDAFWVARRAGGVQQAKRLPLVGNAIPVKAQITGGQERLIISGSDRCAWPSRNIDIDNDNFVVYQAESLLDEWRVFAVHDQNLGRSVLQRKGDVGSIKPRVERVKHGTQHRNGIMRLDHFRNVRCNDGHCIETSDAEPRQG